VTFKSRNALFDHLRSINWPGVKPFKTYSDIQEARKRRREKLSFKKFIQRLERVKL